MDVEYNCVRHELALLAARSRVIPRRFMAHRNAVFLIDGWRYWIVQTGLGEQTARFAEQLIPLIDPDVVCLLGFAGALDDSFLVGDVIEPAVVRSTRDDGAVTPARIGLAQNDEPMLTAREIAASPAAKAELHERFGCATVDMEAFDVGQVCEQYGKPFHTARAISDAADETFPMELDGIITPAGDLSVGRLALAVAKKPTLVGPLYRLWRNSRKAKQGLREIVHRLVKVLS